MDRGTDIHTSQAGQNQLINSHKYCQLIFNKEAKAVQWSKDSFSNKWNNWTLLGRI